MMQGPRPEIDSSEQRLLRLKFAVQTARVGKIKEYLQALEKDFQELENAMRTTRKAAQCSDHETDTPALPPSAHPKSVAFDSACTAAPSQTVSEALPDPISHGVVCKQLPHQLALLSTMEPSPTCFCGLSLSGRATGDRYESDSLVVPTNSPNLESGTSGRSYDANHDREISQLDRALVTVSEPNYIEDSPSTFSSTNDEDKSPEPQFPQKGEPHQPELCGEEALKQLGGVTVDPIHSEVYGGVPLEASYTVFASFLPHNGLTQKVNDEPSNTKAKNGVQGCEENPSNNAECAGLSGSYMTGDCNVGLLKVMQQQPDRGSIEGPTRAILCARAQGASDMFTQIHSPLERKKKEDTLLQEDNCFAARMACRDLLNARLHTQGVLPGFTWAVEERGRIRLRNQLQRDSPTHVSPATPSLSWTRGIGGEKNNFP